MNSRSTPKLQRIFLILAILCLVFPLVSLILNIPGFQLNKNMDEDQIEKLCPSPTTLINHDEWTETHGYANEDIDWSFSTSPSQVINVWVLDSVSYSQFSTTGIATGYKLTTSASGSGSFDVSSFIGQIWYVIFWNDFSGSQSTTVIYNVVFKGEPSPSDDKIFITKPNSTSELVIGTTSTVEWSTSGISEYCDFEISIYKGENYLGLIESITDNDGSDSWSVLGYHHGGFESYPFYPGNDYRIKITNLNSYTLLSNMSDYFSIITSNLTITEPISNSSCGAGDTIIIRWISDDIYEYLTIELYTRNTNGDDRIDYVNDVLNNGSYRWTDTSNLPSGQYYFRIYPPYYGTRMLDQSEDFFIIGNKSSIPGYSIILILGISSIISSILTFYHLNFRKKVKKYAKSI